MTQIFAIANRPCDKVFTLSDPVLARWAKLLTMLQSLLSLLILALLAARAVNLL